MFSRYYSLLIIILLLAGCTHLGPIGSENFDESFSRTLEQEEKLLYYTPSTAIAGTYAENEIASFPSYEGMLILSDKRLIFSQWNKKQKRYVPLAWILYRDIKKMKRSDSILVHYVAVMGVDGSKNAYDLPNNEVVDKTHTIMKEQIIKFYQNQRHGNQSATGN